jgi:hypothetical protein
VSGVLLTYENVRATCDDLPEAIGKDRFARIIETFSPEEAKGLPAYQLKRAQAHPLAVQWHALMQEVQASEAAGRLQLSEGSVFLVDHLIRLKGLLAVRRIERILRRLEVAAEYHSAMFEILILSHYRQGGANIEVVQEKPGVRTADLVVHVGSNDVYIECKSLEDQSRREERLWEQIEQQIIKALNRFKRSWRVSITSSRVVTGRDIATVNAATLVNIRTGNTSPTQTSDGAFSISFEPFEPPWDTWRLGDLNSMQRRTEHGYAECEQGHDAHGRAVHRNPMTVEVTPFFEPDQTGRILDDVNDAHGQIPAGSCGILHVEIPFRDGPRLLDVGDQAFQRVFGLLRSKPRLNAAVLSARTFLKNVRDGENPVYDYFVIVPNGKAGAKLPKDFAIQGWNETLLKMRKPPQWQTLLWWWKIFKLKISDWRFPLPTLVHQPADLHALASSKEGTLFIEFVINQPLPEQQGKSLLNYCTRDGLQQLRLWQSFKNHFRADIVYPSFGRRTFRGDLNDLTIDEPHRLALSWSDAAPSLAVDGRLLHQIVE